MADWPTIMEKPRYMPRWLWAVFYMRHVWPLEVMQWRINCIMEDVERDHLPPHGG